MIRGSQFLAAVGEKGLLIRGVKDKESMKIVGTQKIGKC
jgi:hypothetical protein